MAGYGFHVHLDWASAWRGIRAMQWPHGHVNYAMRFLPRQGGPYWWAVTWTPIWHKGRGPYVSIGLGLVAFYRGY